MITPEEFDKIICGTDYSNEESKTGWAVIPFKKPPIDKDLADFIEKMRLSNMGVPYCWHCWEELRLNENNDIYCPNCGLVIEVKKE